MAVKWNLTFPQLFLLPVGKWQVANVFLAYWQKEGKKRKRKCYLVLTSVSCWESKIGRWIYNYVSREVRKKHDTFNGKQPKVQKWSSFKAPLYRMPCWCSPISLDDTKDTTKVVLKTTFVTKNTLGNPHTPALCPTFPVRLLSFPCNWFFNPLQLAHSFVTFISKYNGGLELVFSQSFLCSSDYLGKIPYYTLFG